MSPTGFFFPLEYSNMAKSEFTLDILLHKSWISKSKQYSNMAKCQSKAFSKQKQEGRKDRGSVCRKGRDGPEAFVGPLTRKS